MRFLRSRGDFFTIARSVVASAQEMCILREFTYKMSLALQGHENDVVITKLYTLFLLILAQLDERRGGQRRDGMTLLRILRHIPIALSSLKITRTDAALGGLCEASGGGLLASLKTSSPRKVNITNSC